jgi:hypothetical protein
LHEALRALVDRRERLLRLVEFGNLRLDQCEARGPSLDAQ